MPDTRSFLTGKNLIYVLTGIILVLTVLSFSPILNNELTNWDDDRYITENPIIRDFSSQNLKRAFSEPVVSNYHPLTVLSLSLNYQIGELNPFGYFFGNLLLHLINIALVFGFIYLISEKNIWVSAFCAMLFALHPMHVESVAWASERKDVLYTLFFMSALILYWKYIETPDWKKYGGVFLLFGLSLLSKPAAVTLPLILLLMDYWAKRRWTLKVLLEKAPFFLLSLVIGIVTIQFQTATAIGKIDNYSIFQKILFTCYGVMFYILKLFVPVHLSSFYPYPDIAEGLPPEYYVAPVFIVLLGLLVWFSRKRFPALLFGIAFFILNIFLVLQWIEVGSAIVSERYTYVPYIGLFFALGMGGVELQKRYSGRFPWLNKALLAAMILIGLSFAAGSFQRTKVWKNSFSLWTDVIGKFPEKVDVAYNNLGNHYFRAGDYQKAIEFYQTSIKVEPANPKAWNNQGQALKNLKKLDDAIASYSRAIQIDPTYYSAWFNRGNVYYQKQQYRQAIDDMSQGLQLNPNWINGYIDRGRVYVVSGDYQKAISDYSTLIKLRPNDFYGYNGRAICYQNLGQNEKALADMDMALKLNPNAGQYYYNRATLKKRMGLLDGAKQDALQAQKLGIQVDPDFFVGLP